VEEHKSFLDLDENFTQKDQAKIAILPVPYDKTSTWVKGADKGPFSIIEASGAVELYDIETDFEVYKKGIYTCPPVKSDLSPEELVMAVEEAAGQLVDAGKFVVTLGGEHSVSVGAVKAHSARYEDLCVLQLDAHADLREEYEGSRYSHACFAARAKEACPVIQIGVRSMSAEEKPFLVKENVFFAKDIHQSDQWIEKAISRLSPNVYISIDLDVFDPSIMPSTGTPEPGGLTWYPVIKFLRAVSENKNITGFDVAELCPNENNKSPDFLAAKLIYKLLGYAFGN